jgi:NAD(P)-dependent dehydrogenase (short-subunit alcohol dehydrogenase family)
VTTQPDLPLAGQVGIITGAGKGLGRAFAIALADLGAAVVVNNRNRQVDAQGRGPADHVVAEILATGGEAVADHSDVTDPSAPQRLVDLAHDTWGRLDFLIANAAVSGPAMFHKTTSDDFEAVLTANILGTTRLAALAYTAMRDRGYGRIVLVASTAGLHGEPTASAYATSKGAVIALGRTIAVEGVARGVHTNILLPYATTQMTDAGMNIGYRDVMTPESVAPVAAALVDPTCQLNGQVIVSAAGALRVATSVEWETVKLPPGRLTPSQLTALLQHSRTGTAHDYTYALEAFLDLAAEATG